MRRKMSSKLDNRGPEELGHVSDSMTKYRGTPNTRCGPGSFHGFLSSQGFRKIFVRGISVSVRIY
jgi:hypothetical protein